MVTNYLKLDNWYLRSLSGGYFCLEKRISKNKFYQLFKADENKILPPANMEESSCLLIVNRDDIPFKKYPMFKGIVMKILEEVKCYE